MNRLPAFWLLLLALMPFFTAPMARAANLDVQNYKRGFALLDAGHPEQVAAYAHGRDPILNKVLRGYYLAQPGNDANFDEVYAFVTENPDWHNLKGILGAVEPKIPNTATPFQVANWFTAHPPVTLIGFYRAIDAMDATGQTENTTAMIRARWTDGDFNQQELAAFGARFSNYLGAGANWARLDHLLWKNDALNARAMYPYVDTGMKATAEARLALAAQKSNATSLLARVPGEWQSDPGLLYEQLHWCVRNNDGDCAIDILTRAPAQLGRADLWWDQRQVMIRRSMEKHDYDLAYKLASEHGQTDNKTLTQGEFLAGWLALRFLNQPDAAKDHFQLLYDNSTTPISRARGAYWLGRTYEALNDRGAAEASYENAAALNITYYGQLAATRLYSDPTVTAMPEPAIPSQTRDAFFNHDLIRAIKRLHDIDEDGRARSFFHTAMDNATQRSDFALLTELAYQIQRPDLAIEAAKAANQKNMLMAAGGFPLLERNLPRPPEPAFIHALIRQESMFNPDAASPAGAYGLMQVMPATAKYMSKKLGIKYRKNGLTDPDYNLRLGTAFIQNQIDTFDGSYVLALAGYNAGPGRVREWMNQIGDPRSPNVDTVDWVESIPVAETRNYIQRIMESLQIYRARLNGGQAPLMILKDLKR